MNRPAPLELDYSGGSGCYICLLEKNRSMFSTPTSYRGRARETAESFSNSKAFGTSWNIAESSYRRVP